jgi:hypothetical protein
VKTKCRSWQATRRSFLLGCGFALFACGEQNPSVSTAIEVGVIETSSLGPIEPMKSLFQTQASWLEFWYRFVSHSPWFSHEPPSIDWSSSQIAILVLGPKPRCTRLEFIEAQPRGDLLVVKVKRVEFGQSTPSSCIGPDMFVANLALALSVPKGFQAVRFDFAD